MYFNEKYFRTLLSKRFYKHNKIKYFKILNKNMKISDWVNVFTKIIK